MSAPASEVVVVTGASAGIGRATALAFARQGATVALLARGEDRLNAAAQEVKAAGGRPFVVALDVANADAVFSAAERIEAACGPIDIWVNNAMATVFSPVDRMAPEEFLRATEVTYLGAVYGTIAALRRMKAHGRGTIVQVGSALAYRSIPLQAAYCGAKHALRGFTDSLRCELIHDRSPIRLVMVHLSGFNTPQFDWGRNRFDRRPQPLPPIFQPEVAADGIVWAAHHARRRELWIGFPALQAIVANRLAPGVMDRLMAWKAYEGQFTGEAEPADRPDNLAAPVPGHFGVHGRFDSRAHARSWLFEASRHRTAVGLALFAASVAVVAALMTVGLWTAG